MPEPTPAPGEPQKDNTPPVVDNPGMPKVEVEAVEPVEAAPAPEPQKKDPLKAQDDIIPESKRFKEVYGSMKTLERKVEAQDKIIEASQEHNQKLQKSMEEMEDRYSDTNRPDPVQEPDAYGKWVNAQIERGIDRAVHDVKPTPAPATTATTPANNDVLGKQIEAMETIYDDYNDVIRGVQKDIDTDVDLRTKLSQSSNAPKAAYEYGIKKMKDAATKRNNSIDQGYVEGGTTPPIPKGDGKATTEQIVMARNLGVSIEKYMEQAKQINEGQRRRGV